MGLTLDEQDTLHDLADMTMKVMVDRRYQLQTRENPAQLIAYTAHDLMTPLTGVQLSLSLLKEDEEVQRQLGSHHLELLKTAANCSDLMIRICQTVIDTLRQETPASLPTDLMGSTGNIPVTKMAELVSSLSMIMEPIPKPVPLIITLDPSVPAMIMSDDLKLFRSALNLLSHALSRTELGYVHMKIFSKEETGYLLFECENTGRPVEVEEYQYLFQPSRTEDGILRLGLSSVASLINALDGEYGFRPRGVGSDGTALVDAKGRRQTGSVFWFSVPLFLPDTFGVDGGGKFPKRKRSVDASPQTGPVKMPVIPLIHRAGSTTSIPSSSRHGQSASLGDILQTDAVNGSCLNEPFASSVQPTAKANPFLDRKMPALPRSPPESQNGVMQGNGESSTVPVVASLPTQKDKPSAPRVRRALVIDDSLVVRKSIAVALKKMGFEVTQARDGMEGFACLKETMFDITLCDFLMPVMDGMDCVKQYREWEAKNRSWFRQLVIGISAHASANDHGQGIKAGMDDFVPKPISIMTLTEIQDRDVVRNRTKQLDELDESSASSIASANVVDGEPAEPAPSSELKRGAQEIEESEAKRRRTFPVNGDEDHEPTVPVCLIATDTPSIKSSDVLTKLESNGWKVIVIHDGNDALRLLQMRNWDAVLIDDDLPVIAGTPCVTKFREWEQNNRVNIQKNVCLVCDGDIPSPDDKASVIQPPAGIDGVLRNPVQWKDLNYYIQKSKKDGPGIVVRDQS
jgi:CheY-like chemotaxis protein/signal transduction histidine kinase